MLFVPSRKPLMRSLRFDGAGLMFATYYGGELYHFVRPPFAHGDPSGLGAQAEHMSRKRVPLDLCELDQ